jgi:hypothetical protein
MGLRNARVSWVVPSRSSRTRSHVSSSSSHPHAAPRGIGNGPAAAVSLDDTSIVIVGLGGLIEGCNNGETKLA